MIIHLTGVVQEVRYSDTQFKQLIFADEHDNNLH